MQCRPVSNPSESTRPIVEVDECVAVLTAEESGF
jgi:hypothetical protein